MWRTLGIRIVGRVLRGNDEWLDRAIISGERERDQRSRSVSPIFKSLICGCLFDTWRHANHHTFGSRQGKYETMTDPDFSTTYLWLATCHIVAYKPSQNQRKEEENQMEDCLHFHTTDLRLPVSHASACNPPSIEGKGIKFMN